MAGSLTPNVSVALDAKQKYCASYKLKSSIISLSVIAYLLQFALYLGLFLLPQSLLKEMDLLEQFGPGSFEGTSNIKKLTNSALPNGIFSGEDELWILECSKNLNPAQFFSGNKIDLTGMTILSDDGRIESNNGKIYESIGIELPKVSGQLPRESLVTFHSCPGGSDKLVAAAAPLRGYVMVRERVQGHPIPILRADPKTSHVMPKGIMQRHPIYSTELNETVSRKKVSRAVTGGSRSKKVNKTRKNKVGQS